MIDCYLISVLIKFLCELYDFLPFSFLKVSAMVTGEFYTRGHFPGFGRPFVFNAEILLKFVMVFSNLF